MTLKAGYGTLYIEGRIKDPKKEDMEMTKKFNLYEELQNNGFKVSNESDQALVRGDFSREIEVAWYGMQRSTMKVEVWFNPEKTVCRAYYYSDGCYRAFKVKDHLADKRAFNAIKATVENNGYAF